MMKKIQARALWSIGAVAGVTPACSLMPSAPSIQGITRGTPVAEPPLLQDDFSDSDSAVEYEDGGCE